MQIDVSFLSLIVPLLAGAVGGAITVWVKLNILIEKVTKVEGSISLLDNRYIDLLEKFAHLKGGVEAYISRQSPLNLTEKGKALLVDSKGIEFINKNKEHLIKLIKKQDPQTAYDVQELARAVLQTEKGEPFFNHLKNYAFQEGLKLDLIIDILGIYLRDIALKELGFNIRDIKD